MFRIDPDFVIDATEDGGLARYEHEECHVVVGNNLDLVATICT